MGLTERHLFEDEEPELTESQLEDILWENNKIFERGYQKGFFDGKSALLQEQEPVEPEHGFPDSKCPNCGTEFVGELMYYLGKPIEGYYKYCPGCGRRIEWNGK